MALLLPLIAPLAVAQDDRELVRVVALFRHGVRAPLHDLNDAKQFPKYTPDSWPTDVQWRIPPRRWGDLTSHGAKAAQAFGEDQSRYYRLFWRDGFDAFLWMDVDPRNRQTGAAFADGMSSNGIRVSTGTLNAPVDPLFHPFKSKCVTASDPTLRDIAEDIRKQAESWWTGAARAQATAQLRDVLACDPPGKNGCTPIDRVTDKVSYCTRYDEQKCKSLIVWNGKFSWASTASEAFLLEYANFMAESLVGWNRVKEFGVMLALHEFYFDQTQRRRYLAQVEGSNLLREIRGSLNGSPAACHRSTAKFVGLVGHDTNIANVGALLGLRWNTGFGFPDNEALPGGALVFELWRKRTGDDVVRIVYVSQTPAQLRTASRGAQRDAITCNGRSPCEIPLRDFNEQVQLAIADEFLTACEGCK